MKKENKPRKKMKASTLAAILLPISAVTLAAAIAVPILSNTYEGTLDTVFGSGKLTTIGGDSSKANYYNKEKNADATAKSVEHTKAIAEQGITLLKNDNCLPLSKDETISPLGYNYYHTDSVGGSANWNNSEVKTKSFAESLADTFHINSEIDNITKSIRTEEMKEKPGTEPMKVKAVNNWYRYLWTPVSGAYEGKESSFNNTIGVMVVARRSGEGADLKMDAFSDGTRHTLSLTNGELDCLRVSKTNAKKTILVINSVNAFEITDDIAALCDAIIWMPQEGSGGAEMIGKIMCGEVNPSGRTVDTWSKDFLADPANQNFSFNSGTYATVGNIELMYYNNVTTTDNVTPGTYVEYEEGIYVGYKYYETAYAEALNGNYEGFNYDRQVQYPFGHGLSYTTFNQSFVDKQIEGNKVTLKVKVENTGEKAGRDAVQIYYGAPYTDFDKANKIEKSAKNLIAYDKTEIIEPGKSQELTLTFNVDDMSSYYSNRDNKDGTRGCYYLSKGEYDIYLGKNAHDSYETYTWNNLEDVYYDNKNPRESEKAGQAKLDKDGNPTNEPKKGDKFVAATNLFESSTAFMNQDHVTQFTRADFKGSFPTVPTEVDKTLADEFKKEFDSYKKGNFDPINHPVLGNGQDSKVRNIEPFKVEQKGLDLSSYRGVDYNDPSWNDLIRQISFRNDRDRAQLGKLIGYGAYQSDKLDAIGKFQVQDFDGPMGFSTFGSKKDYSWATYTSQALLAATFNPRLAYEMGYHFGQEGLANDVQGLYAPGLNLHRSQFGGRNAEYVSEDPFVTGIVGMNLISGASDGGIYTFMKHFAMNEQESNRMDMIMTWATEQTIRETYLKPFEIATKYARQNLKYIDPTTGELTSKKIRACNGVMTAFNSIGPVMCSNNWYLLEGALRGEWGFEGMVITDYAPQVSLDAMIRSGNDFYLAATSKSLDALLTDSASITALHRIQDAVKNISYAVVNSGAYNGIAPGAKTTRSIAPWKVWINYFFVSSLYAITAGLIITVGMKFFLEYQDKKKAKQETPNE